MGILGFGKKKVNLEQMAKDAIIERKITLVENPPDGDYIEVTIKGTGTSESDYKGALEHFSANLLRLSPALILSSSIRDGTEILYASISKPRVKAIYATGYVPRNPSAA
ncbi:MAG: hypothetical protein ABSG05_00200 [Candidatus Pacearchaeota archaeon]|jgi:hypothetical protein